MKKLKIVKWIMFGIAVAINIFIIVNSCIVGEVSAKESSAVAEVIETVINTIQENTINESNIEVFKNIVRKSIGHFSLFLVNGVFTTLAVYYFTITEKWYKFYLLFAMTLGFGLIIAGVSEMIQIFTDGRVGAWSDIGIDFAGYALGAGAVVLILFLTKKLVSQKIENN